MLTETPPHYYRPGEVHAIRRRYRRQALWLVFYMVVVVAPLRMVADFFTSSVPAWTFLKPYILPAIVVLALVGWVSGVLVIFHRDRMVP